MACQQRNGRIDRYGQTDRPEIFYLLTETRNDRIAGDVHILELLVEKDKKANENIGDPSSFTNLHDVEEEEKLTARAIEEEKTAEEFDAELEAQHKDPFAMMLEQGANRSSASPPIEPPASLRRSDFDFVSEAVSYLQSAQGRLKAKTRPKERLIELTPSEDLERRLKKLPQEVRDQTRRENTLLLTADPDRMMSALEEARREEEAWPAHHYLWAVHPIVDWAKDRMRDVFGRHTAPVLFVGDRLPLASGQESQSSGHEDHSRSHDLAVIVSGLLPDRHGRPLVHRWYVALFKDGRLADLEELPSFVDRTGLGQKPLPNPGADLELDLDVVATYLPHAVDSISDHFELDRAEFRAQTQAKLAEEKERLETLRQRKLDYVEERYGHRKDTFARNRREEELRCIERIFREHHQWVEDSMTVGKTPFVEVIAALVANPTLPPADSCSPSQRRSNGSSKS
jgi:hypothetical protein